MLLMQTIWLPSVRLTGLRAGVGVWWTNADRHDLIPAKVDGLYTENDKAFFGTVCENGRPKYSYLFIDIFYAMTVKLPNIGYALHN